MMNKELMSHMFYNERDYLPTGYKSDDPEKEEIIKKLVPLYSMDPQYADPANVSTDDPDFWMLDKILTKEEAALQ